MFFKKGGASLLLFWLVFCGSPTSMEPEIKQGDYIIAQRKSTA
ncbi:MAG: hypothetical protein TRG1_1592 [Flavobacteriaceae bacterium FS1-H7996/R]|nr:MAG: hypothetical protein TRG1_1592 [Flavobacteriaceae bacterium FS1-H7996/R]